MDLTAEQTKELDALHGCGYTPLRERLKPSESCVPAGVLAANIESSLKRRLRWVTPIGPHEGTAVICAGGPSLADNLQQIKLRFWREHANIVAINGSVQYLHANGIKATFCVLLDPQEILAEQIDVVPGVTWLVASQCHPTVFDKLKGQDVFIWHAHADCDVEGIASRYRDDFVVIPGGSTAALRALGLLHSMGFRTFHYYGLDGSFSETRHHAYDQPADDNMPIIVVKAKQGETEREFVTRRDYARQADEFMTLCDQAADLRGQAAIKLFVHGDGLIPFIWRQRRKHVRSNDAQGG